MIKPLMYTTPTTGTTGVVANVTIAHTIGGDGDVDDVSFHHFYNHVYLINTSTALGVCVCVLEMIDMFHGIIVHHWHNSQSPSSIHLR
jgi:hypothetical protein